MCPQWKKSNVVPTAGVMEKKTLELAVFQDNVEGSDMDLLNMLQNEVNELIELEELKWHQMSKQEWLQHGDKNSKFFHASVNQRKNKNVINSISNSGGVNVSDPVEVEGAFLHHFRTLFKAMPTEGMEGCLSGIERKITLEMNASLLQPCTLEEASLALQEMGPFKSASPDGFTATFYQQNWSAIGEEVCRAISSFISVGFMDEEVNLTYIVLIPKKNNPASINDFQPISLCNVFYKITSKVSVNRLKVVLPVIISPNQSALFRVG
jgi:hypothetical protein